jgi:hypothetical protein
MLDARVVRILGDALLETEALEPWRKVRDELRTPRERRWEELKTYTMKQIAKAGDVRTSLIKKYVREGVRGVGVLAADQSGRVSVAALEYFASVHQGTAKQIARRAIENLRGVVEVEEEETAEIRSVASGGTK